MSDWRDDPKSHTYIPPCGAFDGMDICWLCALPRADHEIGNDAMAVEMKRPEITEPAILKSGSGSAPK